MINLCKETTDVIKRIVEAGKIFNLEVFVVDSEGIRAKSDSAYIFLSEKKALPFLEFDSLCVKKISEFNSRLNLVDKVGGDDGYDIQVSKLKEMDSGDKIVYKLLLMARGTAVEVGCADGSRYKLPWGVDDDKIVTFPLNQDNITVITGFSRIVQNKNRTINIKSVGGIIVASASDTTGDTATHVISETPTFHNGTKDFSFMFNVMNLLPMMRGKSTVEFTLTDRGILMTEVNGINVMIFPEKISTASTQENDDA